MNIITDAEMWDVRIENGTTYTIVFRKTGH